MLLGGIFKNKVICEKYKRMGKNILYIYLKN